MILFFSGSDPISGGGKEDDHKTFQYLLQKYGNQVSHEQKKVLEDFASKLKQTPRSTQSKKKPEVEIQVKNIQPSLSGKEEEEQEFKNIRYWINEIYKGRDNNKKLVGSLEFLIAKDLQRLCKAINNGDIEGAKKQSHKLRQKYPIPPVKKTAGLDLSTLQTDPVSNDLLYTFDPSAKGRIFTVRTTGNGSCFFHCLSTR